MNTDEQYRPIKEWNEDDRPREKFLNKGRSSLSKAELIAILLRSGTRQESAIDLARRILNTVDSDLIELGKLKPDALQKINGIGPTKAVTIAAALELGRRRQEAELVKKQQITSSKDIFQVFGTKIGDLLHEEFWVMTVNRNNRILGTRMISSGGITGTVADVRMILRYCLEMNATGLILSHNHPSGNLKPSEQDLKLTHSIKQAAGWMDIELLDHVIVTETAYFSFADEGKL